MINRKTVSAFAAFILCSLLVLSCQLGVNDPVRLIPIIEPYISVQPQSFSYDTNTYTAPPELEVKVWEWRREDGNISYQWYTFSDIEDYCENGGTPITGATAAAYTPSGMENADGNIYFYYVIVTNNFIDGTDRTEASIQSTLSMISFYNANTSAPFPVITRHPVNAEYTIGRAASISSFEARAESNEVTIATGPTRGSISYQWYSNEVFSSVDGTLIDGADKPSYMPELSSLKRGENYFYVEITNTVRVSQTVTRDRTITALPIIVNMLPGEKAEAPRIAIQPKDQMIFSGGTAVPLVVEGVSLDNGEITYQWYEASAAGDERILGASGFEVVPVTGTIITGATNGAYTPPVTAGKKFYYANVINTNEDVIGDTTAILRSKIATVNVTASGSMTANATITLSDPRVMANRFQFIRGYGGMDTAWANFPVTTAADTELMYNQEWGLGYNINRIMIVPQGTASKKFTSIDDTIDELLDAHRPDFVNNVIVTNRNGGYVLASPWTPPAMWKTNNSINAGGHLIHAYYKSFAKYLRDFAQTMYYRGAPIYVISISNEPNYAGGYDGCEWTPEQMRDFWIEQGRFTEGVRGWGGGRSIPTVLTMNGESANTPAINFATLADPQARAAVDLYARHVYGEQTTTLWSSPFADWREDSPWRTECWMTEHNINSATPTSYPNDHTWNYVWRFMNDVDLVIRLNYENAFVWWASKRFYSMIGDGQYGTTESEILPRGAGLSHYAKYSNETTRFNFTMTGTDRSGTALGNLNMPSSHSSVPKVNNSDFSLDNPSAKITAYVSQDGNELSLVMFTPTNIRGEGGFDIGVIEIKMPPDFEIGSAHGIKTVQRDVYFEGYPVTVSADRKSAFVDLGRSQILSVKFIRK